MKKPTISSLKKKADIVFSKWIRARDKACFTCGSRENLQCGHFISRGKNITRYDEENCHAQCVSCNIFKNGNYPVYAMMLGEKMVRKLVAKSYLLHQFKREELEKIISDYKTS